MITTFSKVALAMIAIASYISIASVFWKIGQMYGSEEMFQSCIRHGLGP